MNDMNESTQNLEDQLESIEISIDAAKKNIERGKMLDKLREYPEFKSLVLEGYFEREASRLVLLKADPSMQGKEHQEQIIKNIDAIGFLRQYFNTIYRIAEMSSRALKNDEETREELLGERMVQ